MGDRSYMQITVYDCRCLLMSKRESAGSSGSLALR